MPLTKAAGCSPIMSGVNLKEKTSSPSVPEVTRGAAGGSIGAMKRLRRAGVLLAASGALLLALAAGDVLAGAEFGGGDWADVLHGSSEGETTSGMEGDDLIYGLSGGDSISGVRGSDEVYGGPGRDVLLGGPGDDFIEAKDGVEDFVVCGAGHDVASVDKEDFVSRDCEIAYRA